MKLFVFACLIAAVVAAPAQPVASSGNSVVLKYENDNFGTGNFNYEFEQNDGTKAEAHGDLKNGNSEDAFVVVKGSFDWVGPDGVAYNVVYTADENGYHPVITQGAGGVVPDEVVKSLVGR